jgi:hypothetical protein
MKPLSIYRHSKILQPRLTSSAKHLRRVPMLGSPGATAGLSSSAVRTANGAQIPAQADLAPARCPAARLLAQRFFANSTLPRIEGRNFISRRRLNLRLDFSPIPVFYRNSAARSAILSVTEYMNTYIRTYNTTTARKPSDAEPCWKRGLARSRLPGIPRKMACGDVPAPFSNRRHRPTTCKIDKLLTNSAPPAGPSRDNEKMQNRRLDRGIRDSALGKNSDSPRKRPSCRGGWHWLCRKRPTP